MGFPGFSNLFVLQAADPETTFRAAFADMGASLRWARGEDLPTTPPVVTYSSGDTVPGRLAWTDSPGMVLVHSSLISRMRQYPLTGWSAFPIRLVGTDGVELPEYSALAVHGRCGVRDLTRSSIVLSHSPGGWGPYFQGHFFAPESWEGTDFFKENADTRGKTPAKLLCTAKAIAIFRELNVQTVHWTALDAVMSDPAIFKPGGGYRLPQDYQQRLEDAYKKAGVPRPD